MLETRYQRMRAIGESIVAETSEMRTIGAKFRLICWLSAALILLSMGGLILPSDWFQGELGFFIVAVLILAFTALWQAVQFFILITRTTAFFAYGNR